MVIFQKWGVILFYQHAIYIRMKTLNIVLLINIPVSVGAIVLANPIVKILFERGKFDSNATIMTAQALRCYAIGISASGFTTILNRIFYSMKDTITPMINGVIAMVLNITLNILLVKYTNMQLAGLAFATSISALFTIALLFISLRRKIGSFGGKSIVLGMIKSLISGLLMAVVTLFSYNTIDNLLGSGFIKEVITLALSVGIGAIVYGTSIIILKVDEVNIILEKVKGKLNRK